MPTEVAPGVHRLGNEMVNCYLVEADGGLRPRRMFAWAVTQPEPAPRGLPGAGAKAPAQP